MATNNSICRCMEHRFIYALEAIEDFSKRVIKYSENKIAKEDAKYILKIIDREFNQ